MTIGGFATFICTYSGLVRSGACFVKTICEYVNGFRCGHGAIVSLQCLGYYKGYEQAVGLCVARSQDKHLVFGEDYQCVFKDPSIH